MNPENYTLSNLEDDLSEVLPQLVVFGEEGDGRKILEYCEMRYEPPFARFAAQAIAWIVRFQIENRDALVERGLMRNVRDERFTMDGRVMWALHHCLFALYDGDMAVTPPMMPTMDRVQMYINLIPAHRPPIEPE